MTDMQVMSNWDDGVGEGGVGRSGCNILNLIHF